MNLKRMVPPRLRWGVRSLLDSRQDNRDAKSRSIKNIAVCGAQVPFNRGGAEEHVGALVKELNRSGYSAELINIPYKWYPHAQLFRSIDLWRLLDLSESDGQSIDMVITTKFPSYFANHPDKVLWLIHQYRQIYDLHETPDSGLDPHDFFDRRFRRKLMKMDTYSHAGRGEKAEFAESIGAQFVTADEEKLQSLAGHLGRIDVMFEATGATPDALAAMDCTWGGTASTS